MTKQVREVRQMLADTIAVDLPVLEDANRTGDYDVAFARAAAIRATRLRVRAVLGGGDFAGTLRQDWMAAEPRIDAALAAAPRPNSEPATGRRIWLGQEFARGSESPAGRRSRSTGAMKAVATALDLETYFAPGTDDRRKKP